MTNMVLTMGALQGLIGAFPQSFRIFQHGNLPGQHHNQGCKKEAPSKEIHNKQQGSKHHKMAPVENSASHTALIVNKKLLKRTPKQYANQVTDIKKGSQ